MTNTQSSTTNRLLCSISSILLRPSIWIALIALIAYWDHTCLTEGKWVYDDSGSVAKNVVVIGQVPFTEVFYRDFWGTSMKEVTSHKSFRPLTTMSFRFNYMYNEQIANVDPLDTHSYKFVNIVLHSIVSGLVTEAAGIVFRRPNSSTSSTTSTIAQLVTSILFAIHPIHAEVVSNVTSRGEMLMSIFSLLAFLSYAHALVALEEEDDDDDSMMKKKKNQKKKTTKSIVSSCLSLLQIYLFPWLGMTCSLFSKEQGATTLITLVIWDFGRHFASIPSYLKELFESISSSRNNNNNNTTITQTIPFLRRTLILAIQTLIVCAFRYWLNGETSPDFIEDQNPAGFASDDFTRIFSRSWVYCLYIWDVLYPNALCCDWSGKSIDLIRDATDERIWMVVSLWIFVGWCASLWIVDWNSSSTTTTNNNNNTTSVPSERNRILVTSFFGFTVAPFFLSSNLVVVIGLMKADRVMYFPMLGLCMMQGYFVSRVFDDTKKTTTTTSNKQYHHPSQSQSSSLFHSIVYGMVLIQIMWYTSKTHERNVAWHHSLNLWLTAYAVNPRSHHTRYNCGYELSLKKRYDEAEYVMRPIGNPRVDGPTNTFVYAMVLHNLQRCDVANVLLDDAFDVIQEQRDDVTNIRNQKHMLDRAESNLKVAKAHCLMDIRERGKVLYDAVQTDPSNTYAIQQAQALMEQLERLNQLSPEQKEQLVLSSSSQSNTI